MLRDWDLSEVSDGKKYTENDLAKLGVNDCKGCAKCCKNMGNSIVLDPYDIHKLTCNLSVKFEELLIDKIELGMVDGIILPNIKMNDSNQCPFLNSEERCSIHSFRPGMCRIFPLGRLYEENDFSYFLQVHECPYETKTKVKIKHWIDEDNIGQYHIFIKNWHYFLKSLSEKIVTQSEENIKQITMFILNMFYLTPFRKDVDFFDSFSERLKNAKSALDIQ